MIQQRIVSSCSRDVPRSGSGGRSPSRLRSIKRVDILSEHRGPTPPACIGHDELTSRTTESAQTTFSASVPEIVSKPTYKAYCFDQPTSHFDSQHNATFCQRYWIDASSYKAGGPIFVLDGGETSGADRYVHAPACLAHDSAVDAHCSIPFLQQGILEILSNATGGLSIVLEHRYYGDSVPVPSFSTDDLRFLDNEEALEDSANVSSRRTSDTMQSLCMTERR